MHHKKTPSEGASCTKIALHTRPLRRGKADASLRRTKPRPLYSPYKNQYVFSIYAPAGRATLLFQRCFIMEIFSIHALAGRATANRCISSDSSLKNLCFLHKLCSFFKNNSFSGELLTAKTAAKGPRNPVRLHFAQSRFTKSTALPGYT